MPARNSTCGARCCLGLATLSEMFGRLGDDMKLDALAKFMEAPDENKKDMVDFFNKHSQYCKRAVFLDLLNFYYESADVIAELVVKQMKSKGTQDE